MRSSLTAIGAVSEYQTTFRGSLSGEEMAAQLTAVFPDPVTAATAVDVLMTWQKDCATYARDDLNTTRVTVSQPIEVPTHAGAGVAWLSTYGPVAGDPDAVWFVAEGFVRDGDTLTYLVMQSAGQDYNYEPGQTPLELALRVAAERLVKSR